jgi:hypothetical protein
MLVAPPTAEITELCVFCGNVMDLRTEKFVTQGCQLPLNTLLLAGIR